MVAHDATYSPVGNVVVVVDGSGTEAVRVVAWYPPAVPGVGSGIVIPVHGDVQIVKMYIIVVWAVFGAKCTSTLACKLFNVPAVGTVNAYCPN